jgi:hypothetical protein
MSDPFSSVLSAASSISSTANLAGALVSGNVGSALRSINLPGAKAAASLISVADAVFGGVPNSSDWRVRLSMANTPSFKGSSILKPLNSAGGLIFPYTPTINISSGAKYGEIPTTHTNFNFQSFKSSDPGEITITAPMNVEDVTQGLYWIAAVHYLRSLTKMFAGNDLLAGNPPPVVFLNGYGSYVFKNVPVVVTKFSCTLPNDCDYITVDSGATSGLAGALSDLSGIAGAVGSVVPGLSSITGAIGSVASAVNSVSNLASALGGGGAGGNAVSHIPTKSEFSVTLRPIYSRDSSRNFSLDKFVSGGYLNNPFGYI